ncbi:MAG: hypothetical protein IPG71_07365 [bacterium]|nr:hypothetical protein [bacterium]
MSLLLIAVTAIAGERAVLEVVLTSENTPLRGPRAIQAGLLETLYIADTGHHRLVALDSTGRVTHESSQGGSSGELRWPEDVAVGAAGRVFVADAGNRRIVEFTRLLEWKGELSVSPDGDEVLEPRKLSANSAGDLFVYESDNGQIIRYDQFFAVASRLGAGAGDQEIPSIAALDYSSAFGVMWIEQNGSRVFQSDRFLTRVAALRPPFPAQHPLQLSALDSCFYVSDSNTLWRMCSDGIQDSLDLNNLLRGAALGDDLIFEAVSPTRLYALDRRTGALYRIIWP